MKSGLRARLLGQPALASLLKGLPGRKGAAPPAPPQLAAPQPAAPEPPPGPSIYALPEVATIEEMHARLREIRAQEGQSTQDVYDALIGSQLRPPPIVARMRATDPFSAEYHTMAMELADTLRGRGGYAPARDERLGHSMQERDLWTGLAPFDFRSPLLLAEFYDCFAHMLRQIGAPPPARVLEYGPGSGQFLLSLARLGYQCHAVDIETEYLTLIERQARAMGLAIRGETGVFGEGFEGERFDCIIFFEAFHHAKDFLQLLRRLRQRLNPGGRLILCGEPIFPGGVTDGPIPYPWGPRLDALSIEAFQRGWMELGFQLDFLLEALVRTGWHPTLFHHPTTFRAHMIVSSVAEDPADAP
jgi:SAM-dependent methyltransferase